MERIPEVMDCWFDSGAMPFAQWHYPFENKDIFDKELFPADFICEGIDQTRGWFYSLMAISTIVKGCAPYRNVLVNDLILDKNGKKMSKHVGNTVNPFDMMEKYGADAVRWYLVYGSPAWTPTRFDEDGIKEVISKVFSTLRNTYNFFCLYANIDGIEADKLDVPYADRPMLDRWIISKYNKLIKATEDAMDSYDHMKTVRAIGEFIDDDLSNWYIRRARRRFFAEGMSVDKQSAYATTYEVLVGLVRMMAPIAPFISDEIYTKLTGEATVHTAYYPEADDSLIDEETEKRMDLVKTLVNLGRSTREQEKLKVRQPLSKVIVDGSYSDVIGDLAALILEELNVGEVQYENDLDKYMNFQVKPNFRAAGPVLGKNVKAFGAALAKTDAKEFIARLAEGPVKMELGGQEYEITEDLVDVRISSKEGFVVGMDNNVFVILDTTLTPELIEQGYIREVISKIQQLRKQADFEMMDQIRIYMCADDEIRAAVEKAADFIRDETIAVSIEDREGLPEFDINGHKTGIAVEKQQ
jgi:isoleucyl-tRNA synthetase